MRWQSNPTEGWHTGFAWVPMLCSGGTVVWLEPFRFYFNRYGVVSNVLPLPKER